MSAGEGRTLYPDLQRYLLDRADEAERVGGERRERLAALVRYLQQERRRVGWARLTFICTHNSRRSQMGQILAWALAAHHGVDGVSTYSGGTEATAFAPPAVAALTAAGFRFQIEREGANPVYGVRYDPGGEVLRAFSKVYDHEVNPTGDFCAVMTCSEADANCPVVTGASQRLSLPYEDPKIYDGTDEETSRYQERCREIARELSYVFSRV